jgi:hypothetical protein
VDTTGYVGTPTLPNLDWVLSVGTPEFKRFSFNAVAILGRDENFPEWTSAVIGSVSGTLNLRPTEQLRLGLTFNQDEFKRWSDRSRVQLRNANDCAPSTSTRTSPSCASLPNTPTSSRTTCAMTRAPGSPCTCGNATAPSRSPPPSQRQTARVDVLFSWLPTPGTVLYLGYGDLLRADQPLGSERLRRTSDVFFTKLSWLFRMQ